MATTAKRLYGPAQLGNSTATRYTVPAGTKTKLRHVRFTNPSGSPVTVTASIGADAAGTRVYDAFSLPAGTVHDWFPYAVMDAGEVLAAHAGTAATVVMVVFGDELTLG